MWPLRNRCQIFEDDLRLMRHRRLYNLIRQRINHVVAESSPFHARESLTLLPLFESGLGPALIIAKRRALKDSAIDNVQVFVYDGPGSQILDAPINAKVGHRLNVLDLV